MIGPIGYDGRNKLILLGEKGSKQVVGSATRSSFGLPANRRVSASRRAVTLFSQLGMANVLRIAIVDRTTPRGRTLRRFSLGLKNTVWLEAECSRYAFSSTSLSKQSPTSASWRWTAIRRAPVKLIQETLGEVAELLDPRVEHFDRRSIDSRIDAGRPQEFLTEPLRARKTSPPPYKRVKAAGVGQHLADGERWLPGIAVAGATGGVGSSCVARSTGLACTRR